MSLKRDKRVEIKEFVQKVWNELNQDIIRNFVNSMIRRILK